MICQLTEEFDAASKGAGDDAGRTDFPNFRPVELKLRADAGEIGFDRLQLDVVAHVNDVEA